MTDCKHKLHNAAEVMSALLRGEKVRRKGWDKNSYIKLLVSTVVSQDGCPFNTIPIGSGGWEIYQEPPKEYTFMEMLGEFRSGYTDGFEDVRYKMWVDRNTEIEGLVLMDLTSKWVKVK